jgi:hypothetical protein
MNPWYNTEKCKYIPKRIQVIFNLYEFVVTISPVILHTLNHVKSQ